MLSTVHTLALVGVDAHEVRVEVESSRGPAYFDLIGLPASAVRESRVRVRAALSQLDLQLHSHCVTANLAPADLRKHGSGYDVAIALAAAAAVGHVDVSGCADVAFFGELSLLGELRPVKGLLACLLGAQRLGFTRAIIPPGNGEEAALVARHAQLDVRVAPMLRDVLAFVRGDSPLIPASLGVGEPILAGPSIDWSEVRGQSGARRALEICCAGGHHALLIGPPGGGKTMLARRVPTLLPPLSEHEEVEVAALHSIAGVPARAFNVAPGPPFRAPHHTVTEAGLLGGGEPLRPGEVSLAHRGVLFLDELPEFRRGCIEGLRQPVEDGSITVSRARGSATFPARPLIVAAMNPCACGHAGFANARCRCSPERVRAYRARVSSPIVDRIDVHVVVPAVEVSHLTGRSASRGEPESSHSVRLRIERARLVQSARVARGEVIPLLNAHLSLRELERVARPDAAAMQVLTRALAKLGLSARAYGKVLRVARTIADLDGQDGVDSAHIAEAVHYRVLDRDQELSL